MQDETHRDGTATNGLSAAAARVHEDAGLVRFASAIQWTPTVGSGQRFSADTLRQERMNTFRRAYRDDDEDAGALYEYRERPDRFDGE